MSQRPLRRFGWLTRQFTRWAVARSVPNDWQLAYAMPGFLPRRVERSIVLHQATRHPRTVRAALAAAHRAAGGGRGFMTAVEMGHLEAEILAANVVRVESHAVANELLAYGVPLERIVVAPPGVDLARFKPSRPFDRLTVAFVGTLSLWKGLDVLVALAEELGDCADVAVVGGPVCPWSRRLAARGRFERHVDVPSLLSHAHALVLPSVTEGFGYVVLEAMASGTVPFVSPEVGSAEVVRRIDERLVQPRGQFAEGVAELLKSLPLPDLAIRARTIAEEFDRERLAEKAARQVLAAVNAQ